MGVQGLHSTEFAMLFFSFHVMHLNTIVPAHICGVENCKFFLGGVWRVYLRG